MGKLVTEVSENRAAASGVQMRLSETASSLWETECERPPRPRLDHDLDVDVAIVGAGITGLTTAVLLARTGRRVAVLEAHDIGSGVTGRTSAHLTQVLDRGFHEIESNFGERGAALAFEIGARAIDYIEHLVTEHDIACDFRRTPGYLFTESADDLDSLQKEARTANRLGVPALFSHVVPLDFAVGGLVIPNQARFQPLSYVLGLAGALERLSGLVFPRTRVIDVERGDPCIVRTSEWVVRARDVIVATHSPIGRHLIQTEIAPYRSYVLAARLASDARVPGLFWDTASPYHYLREHSTDDGDLVIVGGADHKTGQEHDTASRYLELERYLRDRFDVDEIVHRWSGEVFEPADGLPYVGRGHEHVLYATGLSGNGLTWGTAAAMLLADLVLEADAPWAPLLSPRRVKPIASASSFFRENANVGARFVADRLRQADARALDDVPPGEGRLVQIGARKVAAYRDGAGQLHTMSPVCTHLGCIVQWNGADKTWDCPCHGGVFAATGEVLWGPPVQALQRVLIDSEEEQEAYEPLVEIDKSSAAE